MVANKQRKNTPAGAAKRAAALARRAIEKAKNVSRNKALRRTVDDLLVNPGSLVSIPGVATASQVYQRGKGTLKKVRDSRRGPSVSLCMSKWYSCLTKPFHPDSTGACIPTGGNFSSARNFGYLRFDAYIGTGKMGFVAISPTGVNNAPAIFYSNAQYAQTSAIILTANNTLAGGVSTSLIPNNRYTVQQVVGNLANPQAICRLVGGGVRIQYTGTNLNLSGLVYVYTSPSHSSAVDDPATALPFTVAGLGAYQECIIKPTSREPIEISMPPHNETELDYPINAGSAPLAAFPWSQASTFNGYSYTGGSGVNVGCPTTLIMFTGEAGQSFHFEYGMHVESVGPVTEGQRMPADSDPVGVDTMMAAISNATIAVASTRSEFADALKTEYSKTVAMRAPRVKL